MSNPRRGIDLACAACAVNALPPPEPGDAYIAGSVEQERGSIQLCTFHVKMRDAFLIVDAEVEASFPKARQEEKPS